MRLALTPLGLALGPLTAVALLGSMALLWLHRRRDRPAEWMVAAEELWADAPGLPPAKPRVDHRPFWLALAAFALLLAAAADPARPPVPRTRVVVVAGATARDAQDVQAAIRARVLAEWRPGDEVKLAWCADDLVAASGFLANPGDVAAVRLELPSMRTCQAELALRTARAWRDARSHERFTTTGVAGAGDVLWIGAAPPEPRPRDVTLAPLPRGQPDLTVARFFLVAQPGRPTEARAYLRLEPERPETRRARVRIVRLGGDGAEVASRPVTVPAAGLRVALTVPVMPPADAAPPRPPRFRAEVAVDGATSPSDGIEVTYAPAPARRVLLYGSRNLYLDAALVSLSPSVRAERRPAPLGATVPVAADWTAFDVVIFDGCAPPRETTGRFVVIGAKGPEGPLAITGRLRAPPPMELAPDHPVTRGVSLADVNMRTADRVALGPHDHALAWAGGAPLIIAREDGDMRAVIFTFDVRQSDLTLRPAFPLLLANAIEWLAVTPPADPELGIAAPAVFTAGTTGPRAPGAGMRPWLLAVAAVAVLAQTVFAARRRRQERM